MLEYEKLKLYPYTLSLHQFESTIILIDVLLSCTCHSILQNYDMYFYTCISKICTLMHIKMYVFLQYYAMKSKNL
jgi:hypothetical protein